MPDIDLDQSRKFVKASGIGKDSPGIVNRVTAVITQDGGNILRLHSLQVADDYALTLVAEFANAVAAKTAALSLQQTPISPDFVISATAIVYSEPPALDGTKYVLTIVGQDRAGILESMTRAFSQRDLSLQSVQAAVTSYTPFQGTPNFKSEFVVVIPARFNVDELFGEIQKVARDNYMTPHITRLP